jgi:diacylglycerol kinase family enzyme
MTEGGKSVALLWNVSSGWTNSKETLQTIRTILVSDGSTLNITELKEGMDISQSVEAAVRAGADVVVAAGGDGTVNAVASTLLYKPTAFGIIPAGTLNHLARDLNLPIDEEKAALALTSAGIISIDAATVNGRAFVNNSVLGFFPYYRHLRERLERRWFGSSKIGRFAAVVAGLAAALWRLPRLTVGYSINGQKRTLRTPFVLVGNNEHRMEGLALGERTFLDRGLLWIYVMRPHTRWQLLMRVIGVLLGRLPRESLFEIFSAPRITIESNRRQLGVGVDGEVVDLKTPLRYESLPRALRVLAPVNHDVSS